MKSERAESKPFEEIVAQYERPIFNLVYRMVGDYDDASDITQAVFLKVYQKLDTYDPAFKLFSWLYKIAINASINHLKRASRTSRMDRDFVDRRPTPEEQVAQSEKSMHLQAALMELKLDYRTVLVLKYFFEMSYGEISALLEVQEKTVKSRLFTARQLLKKILVQRGYAR